MMGAEWCRSMQTGCRLVERLDKAAGLGEDGIPVAKALGILFDNKTLEEIEQIMDIRKKHKHFNVAAHCESCKIQVETLGFFNEVGLHLPATHP